MIAITAIFCIVAVRAYAIPGTPSDFSIIYSPNQLFADGFNKLNEMRMNKLLCDIELQFENSTISAHANVLAATIPYFYSILITDVDTDRNISAALQHLDASAVEDMVQFAYTGSLEINNRNVDALTEVAEFFQIQIGSRVTASTRLSSENVFRLHRMAKTELFANLLNDTREFINENFQEAAQSDGFLTQSLTELIDIISANDLQISSEEIIYEAVINWIKYDEDSRLKYLPQALRHVRLPFINTRYLRTELATSLYIHSIESRELIYQSILERLLPTSEHTIPEWWTQRLRTPIGLIHILDVETKSSFNIDAQDKSIRNITLRNNANNYYSLSSHGGLIYVFGGGYDVSVSNVESYDPTTAVWTNLPPMRVARSMSGATTLNNTIYVGGGYDNQNERLKSVECYNTLTRTWSMIAPMNVARTSHQLVTFDNHVYAIGGHLTSSVEKYDPVSNVWTLISASMNEKRSGFGAVVWNGQIYVCGGGDGQGSSPDSAEVFDPIMEKWTYIRSMLKPRFRFGLVVVNGKIWAIGGLDEHDEQYFIEEYDSDLNTWEKVTFNSTFQQYKYIHALVL